MSLDTYTSLDLPVPYRNIKIYPVTLKDYFSFNLYSQCFLVEKNNIPDVKIISMSNLEYVYYASQGNTEQTPYIIWFDRLLSFCLKDEESFEDLSESIKRYKYDENGKPIFYIKGEKYTSKDFDELKRIICEQNLVDLPDENISKEVRDSLDEARKYKAKISGSKSGSFEDYIISLSVSTGWSFEYIYSMSIRKFVKSIRRLDNLIHYKIYLAASMSGMVEFKDKSFIKHWLTDIEDNDKYKDVSIGLDDMKGKISLESAK